MTGRLAAWALPKATLLLAALASVVVIAPTVAGYLMSGVPAALCVGLGFLTSLRSSLSLRTLHAAALAVPAAMAGLVAVELRGQTLAAACFVALCCLLVAPAAMLADGLLSALPTSVAVLTLAPGDFRGWQAGFWLLVGSLLMVAVATRLPHPPRAEGIEQHRAWRHAIVMAVAVGAVVYLVDLWQLPHGYWVALTVTVVLRPFDDETIRKAAERVAGTVAGVVLALVAAVLLPSWALLVLLLGCTVLSIGYSLAKDYPRQVLFMTPAVVLLGSAGAAPVVIASERALATLAGAVLAGAIALGLATFEARRVTGTEGE